MTTERERVERDTVRALLNGDITRGQFLDVMGYDPVSVMAEAREAAKAPKPKRVNKRRGGIDQLPSGLWRVRYTARGKPVTRSFATHDEASAFRDAQRVAVREGTHVDPRAGLMTFRAYCEQWLAHHGASQSTITAHETRLRVHAFGALGDMRLRDITEDDVRRWFKRDLGSLAPSTRKAVLTSVSAVLATAVRKRLIVSNPAGPDVIKRRRTPARVFTPWEAEDVAAVRNALPEQYAILATLGAGLGVRQGEMFGLSPDDFDLTSGLVTIRRQVKVIGGRLVFDHPKGGEDHPIRQVPLPSSVWRAVEQHLAAHPARLVALPWGSPTAKPVAVPLIVTSREGGALNKNYVNPAIWKPALRAAGMPETRDNGMHALRHHYASTLFDGGEQIKAVAEYLGHADPGFTMRVYSHVMKRSHSRTTGVIDAAFAAAERGSVVTDLSQRRAAKG